jgi:hypothetical protein
LGKVLVSRIGPLASKKKDRNLRLYPIFEGPLL